MRLTIMVYVLGGLFLTACSQYRYWGQPTNRVDVAKFQQANRIEIIKTIGNERVGMISTPAQIRRILEVVEQYSDGWKTPLTGPLAPAVDLFFYRDDEFLGDFGVASTYVTYGGYSQPAAPSQISRITNELDIR